MLSAVMLSAVMLSVVMLSVVMLSVTMPNVVMLSVVAPFLLLSKEKLLSCHRHMCWYSTIVRDTAISK
jgi:hypothetical protein